MKPRRIQRKRIKGWRLADECANPNGYVVVSRPGKWGNPFETAEEFRFWLETGKWPPTWPYPHRGSEAVSRRIAKELRNSLEELRGKDLVCWCALDADCHADVLLEISNQ